MKNCNYEVDCIIHYLNDKIGNRYANTGLHITYIVWMLNFSYPDDKFDRYWEPFGENSPTTSRGESVSIDGFWNLPPLKVFQTQLTANGLQPLELQWPIEPLRNSGYYIALYFADDAAGSSSRSLNIAINNVTFYDNLTLPRSGVALFANEWPLVGRTKIVLTPAAGSTLGPLINGGELFEVIPVGGRTVTRDGLFHIFG